MMLFLLCSNFRTNCFYHNKMGMEVEMSLEKKLKIAFKLSAYSMALTAGIAQASQIDCSEIAIWQENTAYVKGEQVQLQDQAFESQWWNKSNPVEKSGDWQEWKKLGDCDSVVIENKPPIVSINSPLAGSSFNDKDSVVMKADASDPDGTIAKVEFYLDGALLQIDNQTPFEHNWTATLGSHSITAKAFDNEGATTLSSDVTITVQTTDVNQPPVAKLTAIIPDKVLVGDVISFDLSATDTDGQVVKLALTANHSAVFNNTGADTSFTWQATQTGQVNFVLHATDDKDVTAQSNTISVNVVPDDQTGGNRNDCQPAGLYQTPDVNTPYCSIYDVNGREKMGTDHPRRVIGYFTSWRNGANGQPSYLVNDIPWDKITHINYAFAHVDSSNKVSIGDPNSANNPATNMEWPGVTGAELDPNLPYKGHFNLLNKYKKIHPDVKTLISVGGWAETGGYFSEEGRIPSGGFYTMTTNADGSVNQAGIAAFSASAVEFIEKYGFDGVDIDYEYPSSMADAGHPDDFEISNARRAGLNASYQVLMKSLRQALDKAGEAAGKHYMLTIASPSSGYLLRGMETFQTTQYLDYVNIMSYDLHGAWNSHVGHNAALFDTGEDSELKVWDVYGTKEFEGIGYLNTDWAVRYFRGGLSAGRINIGLPYYTRGFKDVTGGTNGLWGQAVFPDQANCPKGTGEGDKNFCGNGAIGIDNLWHDTENDREIPAGSNPLWHTKNLENGITGSYLASYGLNPETDPDDQFTGTYTRHYDSVAVAPWLWNADKKVFLSTEDEESMGTKLDYVINNGLGGVMFWELAGDFDYDAAKGEYFMGSTMTSLAYNKFNQSGTTYNNTIGNADFVVPEKMVNISFIAEDFPEGDDNYPISPTFKFTNNSELDLSGATISFDVPVSTSAIFKSNWNATKKLDIKVRTNASNAAGNNIGGFENEFHRFSIKLINQYGGIEEAFAPNQSVSAEVMYYMPISGPANFTIEKNGQTYAFKFEYPHLPEATQGSDPDPDPGTGCDGIVIADVPTYPNWPQTDWAGNPSHANGGDMMKHNNKIYKAKWWTSAEAGTADWNKVCDL